LIYLFWIGWILSGIWAYGILKYRSYLVLKYWFINFPSIRNGILFKHSGIDDLAFFALSNFKVWRFIYEYTDGFNWSKGKKDIWSLLPNAQVSLPRRWRWIPASN